MPHQEPSDYGRWLRKAREGADITQVELAERSGISSVQISYIETGRTQKPMRATRQRIEAALGLQFRPADRGTATTAQRIALSDFPSLSEEGWAVLGRSADAMLKACPDEERPRAEAAMDYLFACAEALHELRGRAGSSILVCHPSENLPGMLKRFD